MYRKSSKYSFWNTKKPKRSSHNNFNISYCSNCGYKGHIYKECPEPKISLGIIAFKHDKTVKDKSMQYQFLLICRKNTLGFVELIRGKYRLTNIKYIQTIIDQLTLTEKSLILEKSFLELWNILWHSTDSTHEINCVKSNKQKKEYYLAENKFNSLRDGYYLENNRIIIQSSQSSQSSSEDSDLQRDYFSLNTFIENSNTKWNKPEWGFPKGRRNLKESNLDCSKREFMEETGLQSSQFTVFYNLNTLEEVFLGTNHMPYKNIYYIGYVEDPVSLSINTKKHCQASEISELGFFNLDTCLEKIRPYNRQKIKILLEAATLIKSHQLESKPTDFYSNVSSYNFKKGGKV